MMSVPRPAMFVAIGDRAELTGLRDDLGFLFVVLGVEHVVLDALALRSSCDSCSLFSIDTVPTSTGWPLSWQALTCSMTARNFAGLGLVDDVGVVDADDRACSSGSR